jgi:hypothetical protein
MLSLIFQLYGICHFLCIKDIFQLTVYSGIFQAGGLAGIFYDEGLTEINGFNKQSKRLQAINLLNPCSVTS